MIGHALVAVLSSPTADLDTGINVGNIRGLIGVIASVLIMVVGVVMLTRTTSNKVKRQGEIGVNAVLSLLVIGMGAAAGLIIGVGSSLPGIIFGGSQ